MTETLGPWDPKELRRILALAGPADAGLILHHLKDDLRTAGRALELGLRQQDAEAMHRAAHALVALCGTAGASGLHKLAEGLREGLSLGTAEIDGSQAETLLKGAGWLADRLAVEFAE